MKKFIKNKIVFILMIIAIFCISIQLSANGNTNEIREIKIINDSVDISKYPNHLIKFKSIENPNVVSGKIAPGATMYTNIEIDFNQNKKPFDIKLDIDKTNIKDFKEEDLDFDITIDGEKYTLGTRKELNKKYVEKYIENSKNLEINIKLSWRPESNIPSNLINNSTLEFPIKIQIEEHI